MECKLRYLPSLLLRILKKKKISWKKEMTLDVSWRHICVCPSPVRNGVALSLQVEHLFDEELEEPAKPTKRISSMKPLNEDELPSFMKPTKAFEALVSVPVEEPEAKPKKRPPPSIDSTNGEVSAPWCQLPHDRLAILMFYRLVIEMFYLYAGFVAFGPWCCDGASSLPIPINFELQ